MVGMRVRGDYVIELFYPEPVNSLKNSVLCVLFSRIDKNASATVAYQLAVALTDVNVFDYKVCVLFYEAADNDRRLVLLNALLLEIRPESYQRGKKHYYRKRAS